MSMPEWLTEKLKANSNGPNFDIGAEWMWNEMKGAPTVYCTPIEIKGIDNMTDEQKQNFISEVKMKVDRAISEMIRQTQNDKSLLERLGES